MSGAWCLYELDSARRKLIRRFPGMAPIAAIRVLIDHDHRRLPVRLFNERTGEDWERIGGRWWQTAAPDEAAAPEAPAPYWLDK